MAALDSPKAWRAARPDRCASESVSRRLAAGDVTAKGPAMDI